MAKQPDYILVRRGYRKFQSSPSKNTIQEKYIPENAVCFSTVSSTVQQCNDLWDLLFSMLIGGEGKTVHRLIDMECDLHDEIPNINEYKKQVKK